MYPNLPLTKVAVFIFRIIGNIEEMLQLDIATNESIGDNGAKEILKNLPENETVRILTHCNTGSLATAGYGTALGVIRSLHNLKQLGNLTQQKIPTTFHRSDYIYIFFVRSCVLHGNKTLQSRSSSYSLWTLTWKNSVHINCWQYGSSSYENQADLSCCCWSRQGEITTSIIFA